MFKVQEFKVPRTDGASNFYVSRTCGIQEFNVGFERVTGISPSYPSFIVARTYAIN